MFLKEIKDTLKQTGFIMAFLAVMPLIYLIDSFFYKTGVTLPEYMVGGYALLWMIAVGYMAYNMFRPEEKDDAVEYILSLPITRWKLLIWKTVPRVAVLIALSLLALCFGEASQLFYGMIWLVTFVVFTQICGFTLGIVGRKSWIARLILFIMVICAYIVNSIPPEFIWKVKIPASSLFSILVEFGLLALILIPLYRTWDLKPLRGRELSFAQRAIVPMIVFAFPIVYLFSS